MLSPFMVLRPASADAIEPLIAAMSGADKSELLLLAGAVGPAETIRTALAKSSYSFCYQTEEGQPVALGGLCHQLSIVSAWMIAATPLLAHRTKSFLRASLAEMTEIRQHADGPVRVGVDERWRKSLKWLHWLGFEDVDTFSFKGRDGVVLELRR